LNSTKGASEEVRLHSALAVGAGLEGVELMKESLFLQGALIALG
jgi:hypothetical protein